MLLELSTTHAPATDLGYLLHKHPGRLQTFSLAFGKAHVFYPQADAERCTAALLLDVDPVALVRGKFTERTLDQYVNYRPYVSSVANPCAACTNASSPCSPWKVNRWTRACDP